MRGEVRRRPWKNPVMPSLDSLGAFAALAFLLIVVPGPSVLFVVSRAVALGRRAALLTVVGNAIGVYAQVVLVAVGLGAVVSRSIAVFTIVKLFGAAYLVWLGLKAFRHRQALASALDATTSVQPARRVLLDGFMVGISNPKTIVFFAAILPQFIDPNGTPAGAQMAVLGVVFVGIALLSDGAWALAAGTARAWLARSPKRLERLAAGGGIAIAGLGVQLALTGRKD
jgi:threonine/homoserine/homoserine lactone efflux protein